MLGGLKRGMRATVEGGMSCDDMGSLERAWLCAGNGYFLDPQARRARVLWAEGERPILAVPASYDPIRTEEAFGWAWCELREQSDGWLGLVRAAYRLMSEIEAA